MLTGLGVDGSLVHTECSGGNSLLVDGIGCSVALTDAGGHLVGQFTYEPFGNTSSADGVSNAFQYAGRENDGTGLYFSRARYYSPRYGRFISQDPVGFNGGVNLYSYAANSPVTLRDPSGKNPACLIGGLLGSIGYSGYVIYQELSGRKLDYYSGWSGVGHILQGQATAFGAGCAIGSGVGGLVGAAEQTAATSLPQTGARVIPADINATTLGVPRATHVFVTDASAIQGMNAQEVANALTIPESESGFQVIEFETPEGIASPINRANPGFVGGGQTAGGLPEYVVPNGPIPPGANTYIVH